MDDLALLEDYFGVQHMMYKIGTDAQCLYQSPANKRLILLALSSGQSQNDLNVMSKSGFGFCEE